MNLSITHRQLARYLIWVEGFGFLLVLALLWLDELIDLPHALFGAAATPSNLTECVFESIVVLVLAAVVLLATWQLLGGVKHLKGYHEVCTSCLRVHDDGGWHLLNDWLQTGSEAEFAPGTCPDCTKEYNIQQENF